jgi:uncharacterized membrane protein
LPAIGVIRRGIGRPELQLKKRRQSVQLLSCPPGSEVSFAVSRWWSCPLRSAAKGTGVDEAGAILAGLLGLGLVVAMPIMLIVTYVRARRIDDLASRLTRLEQTVRQLLAGAPASVQPQVVSPPAATVVVAAPGSAEAQPSVAKPAAVLQPPAKLPSASEPRDTLSWELFIGRKALGWLAVVVLLFATSFFLRYAFENEWIGPIGRVTMGVVASLALVVAGRRYLGRGWRTFAQMLIAAGVVLLYLSTYSAFGFYHLVPQRAAGLFLFLVVAESMLLALRCESPAIALMAVIGGLLTPLLMHSQHDQYVSLFLYLIVLNAGVVGLLVLRAWPAEGTASLVGTQALFWAWYVANYHPEKVVPAIAFQIALYLLYLVPALLVSFRSGRRATVEDLARFMAAGVFWFAVAYVLLREDYGDWLGSLAVLMAAVYALSTRLLLAAHKPDERLMIVSLALASGFVALALPLQARTHWVAVGWAAEAAALWWFGLRIASVRLRGLAAVFAALAVFRVLALDTPEHYREPFMPILNAYALPSLAAVGCLALALVAARRFAARLRSEERPLVAIAAVACVLLVWWIVSVDIVSYFRMLQIQHPGEYAGGRLAQMSLSAWWATYAAVVLAAGFYWRLALLRWTALGLFALTAGKVFFLDMAELDEIYRIVAFFVLALLLGAAAWAYQRNQPDRPQGRPIQE